MDDKEEYQKALERAKKGLPIDEVFPELKDSEDERIRKILIHIVKGACDKYGIKYKGDEITEEKLLAYLEKQKEPKLESCDCSRDEESYTNGIHHVLMNPEAYGLIKQKPAEQLSGIFTSYDMAKTFTEGQNYVIAHPEKFGLCKHSEWSEEDNVLLKEIVSFFKDGTVKLQHDLDLYAGFLENKFKSLQPHWKPSEKQMAVLKNARYMMGQSGDYYDTTAIIDSLITDLQKLL